MLDHAIKKCTRADEKLKNDALTTATNRRRTCRRETYAPPEPVAKEELASKRLLQRLRNDKLVSREC